MNRTILFDVDGVLVHSRFHPDEAERRLWDVHMLQDLGLDPKRFQDLFGPDFEAVIAGKESLVALLDRFLPTVGYRGSTLDFVSYWLERDSHVNYQLIEGIKALRASGAATAYVATNQEPLRAFHLWREQRLGHIFDDMFYAARLGVLKPDPRFYERVAERIGPQPEPVLFFDDSQAVVDGANAFGWEGVLFQAMPDFTDHPWVAAQLRRGR